MRDCTERGCLMMTVERVAATVGTMVLAWALAASSNVEVRWHAENAAQLRLSWSARPERIEICRRLSDAELESRPVHMRQRVECEGHAATYALEVSVDGVVLDRAVITGAGLRHDRPVFLFREFTVPEGTRQVRVTFGRRESADSITTSADVAAARAISGGEREEREREQRRERALSTIPPHLEFEERVIFRRGAAILVALERGALVLRTP